MRRGWIGTIGLGCALLAGCATPEPRPPVSVDKTMEYLSGGQLLLRCHEPCLAGWRAAQPKAQSLAAAAKWRDLVSLLAGVGYQDDLSLYYLGEAAEGLGFPVAAATYYRQSAEISRSSRACSLLSMQCGGVRLPQAARARLAALERPVKPVRRGPPTPPSGGAAPLSIPSEDTVPGDTVPGGTAPVEAPPVAASVAEPPPAPAISPVPADRPVPPAAPLVAPPPLPRETPVPRAGEDFIEPPPARR
jgi:hypothetical protein